MRLSWIGMLLIGLAAIAPAPQVAIGEYAVPTPGGGAFAIAPGPDHALWFADINGNAIGRCTTAAAIIEYPVPTHGAAPAGISEGPDGAMWFTEQNGNNIGRITPTGTSPNTRCRSAKNCRSRSRLGLMGPFGSPRRARR